MCDRDCFNCPYDDCICEEVTDRDLVEVWKAESAAGLRLNETLTDEEKRIRANEYRKKYRHKHKEHYQQYRAEYYEKNKEKLREYWREYQREYRRKNKEKLSEYAKKYRKKRKEEKIERDKKDNSGR